MVRSLRRWWSGIIRVRDLGIWVIIKIRRRNFRIIAGLVRRHRQGWREVWREISGACRMASCLESSLNLTLIGKRKIIISNPNILKKSQSYIGSLMRGRKGMIIMMKFGRMRGGRRRHYLACLNHKFVNSIVMLRIIPGIVAITHYAEIAERR